MQNANANSSKSTYLVLFSAVFLQVLGLASTQVGDTVVRKGLVRCNQLVKLNLSRTRITDHGELSECLHNITFCSFCLSGKCFFLASRSGLISIMTIIMVKLSHFSHFYLEGIDL